MKSTAYLLLASVLRAMAQVTVDPPPSASSEIAVFGGGEAVMHLRVEAPAHAVVAVVYDILQLGGSALAAPLVSNKTAARVAMDGSTSRLVEIRLPVPEVKRPARLCVQFRIANTPHAHIQQPSRTFLDVYPRPAPNEWRTSLAAAEEHAGRHLAVCGESPRVRAFFAQNRIRFEDLGMDLPAKFPPNILAIAELAPSEFETRHLEPGDGRQILFLDDPTVLPGVYEIRSSGGAFTKVTLPIPAGLADNPKAQMTFLDLLHRNLDSTTP